MVFDSFLFLVFAPIALLGDALLRGRAGRAWLVAASYVFYGWGGPWTCLLLLASTLLDYYVGLRLAATADARARKAWLWTSLVGNLGLLVAFKYVGFLQRIAGAITAAIGVDLPTIPEPTLPAGISFYTFQTLSYTLDVYRGRIAPTRSFLTFALYVAYFPQLVAGPIERADALIGQLEERRPRTANDVMEGLSRVLWGLLKKVVFADWLGTFVAAVYRAPAAATSWDLALATYAFAFQIYLDFSAYCDIAIGLARTMGIRLTENFRWPYLSRNVSEFWQRWHITLSSWLRDYLYVPLGGSRKGMARTAVNLVVVMFLGGLWHGADEKFVVWGLWLGLALAVYHGYARLVGAEARPDRPHRLADVPGILLTFHVVLVSWVFFRASNLGEAWRILRVLLRSWGPVVFHQPGELVLRTALTLLLVAAAHVVRGLGLERRWVEAPRPAVVGVFWGLVVALIAVLFAPVHERFLYFRF